MSRLIVAPALGIACLTVMAWLLLVLSALLVLLAIRAAVDPGFEGAVSSALVPAAVSAGAAFGCRWASARLKVLVA